MRLTDLGPLQIRMMARLAGSFSVEDAVGIELTEMTERDIRTANGMVAMGLAALTTGWNNTAWFALTNRGQKMRETGEG